MNEQDGWPASQFLDPDIDSERRQVDPVFDRLDAQ
jgi:hypothetical protein